MLKEIIKPVCPYCGSDSYKESGAEFDGYINYNAEVLGGLDGCVFYADCSNEKCQRSFEIILKPVEVRKVDVGI